MLTTKGRLREFWEREERGKRDEGMYVLAFMHLGGEVDIWEAFNGYFFGCLHI